MPRTAIKDTFTPDQRRAFAPKIVARNTVKWTDTDGATVFRLHQTDVLRVKANGAIVLNSNGWLTVTTKDRIASYLPRPWRLYSDKGQWYISKGEGKSVPFFDGMELPRDYDKSAKADKAGKRETILRAKIKRFVATMPDPMPMPNNGDCWLCGMRDEKGVTMGEHGHDDAEHLLSHIKEGYLHGSLIFNAIKFAGVSHPELYWQMKLRDQAKRMLRRYLYAKLGLVR